MSDIRVTKSQFEKLIVEYHKQQKSIIKENEMDIDEGFFGAVDEKRALEIINKHPQRKKAYEQLLIHRPKQAKEFVEFFRKNPAANYPIWDPKTEKYYNKESYNTHSGAKATPRPGINEHQKSRKRL